MLVRLGVHGSFGKNELFRLSASLLHIRCVCVFPLLFANRRLLIRRLLIVLVRSVCRSCPVCIAAFFLCIFSPSSCLLRHCNCPFPTVNLVFFVIWTPIAYFLFQVLEFAVWVGAGFFFVTPGAPWLMCQGLLDQVHLWNGLTSRDGSDRCLALLVIFSTEHLIRDTQEAMTEKVHHALN